MAHVSEVKKKTVSEFTKLMDEYPVVGLVNMSNIPAKQLQTMREQLRNKNTVLKMTKKRLMKIAFEGAQKKGIKELEKHFKGQPALVFTKENPFVLYADLQKTKSKAPAKAGQEAPHDIVVTAGATSFSPGPVIGQLGKFGIKTGIEGGKIVIKADSTVAKEGEEISAELAGILTRLGVEPMEIGLDLTAAFEDGMIYTSKVLHIDVDEYYNKFCTSYSEAFNLAVYTAYPTSETTEVLLGKAYGDAKALAVSENIVNDDTASDILAKAYSQMLSLSSSLPDDALSEELKSSKAAPVASAPSQPTEAEKKPDDDNKEEPQKEEDAAAGLGALFG